jgi:hypothetical protein
MIPMPISIIENDVPRPDPKCLWCNGTLKETSIKVSTPLGSGLTIIKQLICFNHRWAITYTTKTVNESYYNPSEHVISAVYLYISSTLRVFYCNNLVSLQKCNREESTWGFVSLLPSHQDSWPHNLNYDELISKVKGYLLFL